jgi:hypothetical protein
VLVGVSPLLLLLRGMLQLTVVLSHSLLRLLALVLLVLPTLLVGLLYKLVHQQQVLMKLP